ncbi:hypothetical protein EYR38_002134 [Pleurotus pulmonarius]|nr:hypothetical protein EYR38_002134 [Pleurotus pulmonarius]
MSAPTYLDAWLSGPDDTRFYTRTYTPPTPPVAVLVFVHGAAEHCGRYTHTHTSLSAEHGIAVFAYDQRGFGKTALDVQNRTPGAAYGKTSWTNQLEDLDWAVRTAQDAFKGVPIFLMGTSMGGGIVIGYLARRNRPSDAESLISGVIAGSPCIKLTREPPKVVIWLALQLARVHPYMLYPVRNNPEDLSRNKETNAAYAGDSLVRTPGSLRSLGDMITEVLFLHGTADMVTSPVAAQALYEKMPAKNKNMIKYPDARHELHNEPGGVKEEALKAVVDFINLR